MVKQQKGRSATGYLPMACEQHTFKVAMASLAFGILLDQTVCAQ